jgi:hypothetical protein
MPDGRVHTLVTARPDWRPSDLAASIQAAENGWYPRGSDWAEGVSTMPRGAIVMGLLCLVGRAAVCPAEAPRPAVIVRPIRPDQQLERLIGLFDGGPVAHPAEALSAWRRATGRHESLSKAAQAAIALLNPEMIPELRTLDGAEVDIWFDGGRTHWFALVPHDDGTFAALTTALALTDGGADEPLSDLAVDRVGPPGSTLLGRAPDGAFLLADDRAGLAAARERLRAGRECSAASSGWLVRVDPLALCASPDVLTRRIAESLRAMGLDSIEVLAGLEGEALTIDIRSRLDGPVAARPIDPAWLDGIPADRVAAAASFSLGPAGWDQVFAVADQIEKADPSRAGAASLRARLGLAALAAGVQPEVDLWPLVIGLTAWVATDGSGAIVAGSLALHTADAVSAQRLERRAIRPLLASRLARLPGGPVEVAVHGPSVLLGWGPGALAATEAACLDPSKSAAGRLRAAWTSRAPARAGALWPGALGGALRPGLAGSLAGAPLIVWHGGAGDGATRDIVRWGGLKAPVRRYLQQLPLDVDSDGADSQR